MANTKQKAIRLFASRLVKQVRDSAMEEMEKIIDERLCDDFSRRLSKELRYFDRKRKKSLERFVAYAIDFTIDHFLSFLVEVNILVMIRNEKVDISGPLFLELDKWLKRYSDYNYGYQDYFKPGWKMKKERNKATKRTRTKH